ncbi:hypothetical protein ELI07_32810 (plasmid) [Rhizobium leguminosarum]|nr:hypothetical protein ELI07_32810 [Rhizobium leguminosarum]TAZ03238.1 hypothetical protein ELH81_30965 [Rhizobium leguminosarum]
MQRRSHATAGHGGFHLSPDRNLAVPASLRTSRVGMAEGSPKRSAPGRRPATADVPHVQDFLVVSSSNVLSMEKLPLLVDGKAMTD